MYRVVTAILICASATLNTKCPLDAYSISRLITDRAGQPISDANITVTWARWPKYSSDTASAVSTRDGSFAVKIPFDTLSGETLMGDVCEARLSSATLSVMAPG